MHADLAIGVSTDGLYVIKDALFNREVGSLFDSGKPIKKGLTFKAKLPIGKMINDGSGNATSGGKQMGNDGVPENVLIDCEVTGESLKYTFLILKRYTPIFLQFVFRLFFVRPHRYDLNRANLILFYSTFILTACIMLCSMSMCFIAYFM